MNATRAQVTEIAGRFAAHMKTPFSDGEWVEGEPTVVEGSHEDSSAAWIISWEDGPWGWVDAEGLDLFAKEVLGSDWYAQPLNSWCVAFYC